MNRMGAKRLFKCFASDLELTQAVCENGQWTGENCLGIFYAILLKNVNVSRIFVKGSFDNTNIVFSAQLFRLCFDLGALLCFNQYALHLLKFSADFIYKKVLLHK